MEFVPLTVTDRVASRARSSVQSIVELKVILTSLCTGNVDVAVTWLDLSTGLHFVGGKCLRCQ